MGLDMYLQAEHKQTGEVRLVHSWRKANQIRQWFVTRFDQDDDAQLKITLTGDDIDALISDIEQVLGDKQLAPNLLPTSSGFFFGSTDYDTYYFGELKDTLQYLKNDFEYDFDNEQLFYTEWW
ncbi:MAG: hypothetical protein Q611_LSC00138G0002 [Leuconostoc sp. DORA_2]|jgi:hypothetical protein|uniref:hypothetical protein n=1 Tax=Leuconostoc TaxID=1243 RepID=UPI0002465795|nr:MULTISPECIES: hypothetical protein [Leuconostoc]ETJ00142.1 MAG: hypothetical protein Q611_LSC00138G0002 [Leuconostoc sp. DORA_2]MBA5937962.1 hypothetical protein [Leuconostoc citreum]MCT3054726.1 hypothetical protein [Leuconostoc citreum]MCT3062932.1 hypothetical protein [Leuconostoc citreum]MCT3073489.1 hypothetical protein [Leuconostoc citreum]